MSNIRSLLALGLICSATSARCTPAGAPARPEASTATRPEANVAERETYMASELPSIVIATTLSCARYDSFEPLEANGQNALMRLRKSLEPLPDDLTTRLSFTHQAFVVQAELENQAVGFPRPRKGTGADPRSPSDSSLFVTTPIESLGSRVVVVLSSVGPERTTIFTVDRELSVELLYDSLGRNVTGDGPVTLGAIVAVHTSKPGHLVLDEGIEPGGRALGAGAESRTVVLDTTKGVSRLSLRLVTKRTAE